MQGSSRTMILLNGEPRTFQIEKIDTLGPRAYAIVFKNNPKKYMYGSDKVRLLSKPQWLQPDLCKVYREGVLQEGVTEIWRFGEEKNPFWRIKYRSGYEQECANDKIQIITSCLDSEIAKNTFEYLRSVATINPLGKEKGEEGILSKLYGDIQFINSQTAVACYLNPEKYELKKLTHSDLIFPFGCNASQKLAVTKAFENQISVIQGPPGTGKTQTILNIVANIVRNGKTVMIVSNNNSATENVREKLEHYGLSFMVATLGKKENKEKFILNQPTLPEDLESWKLETNKRNPLQEKLKHVMLDLDRVYLLQNELAELRQEQQDLNLEWKHFCLENKVDENSTLQRKINSSELIKQWFHIQTMAEKSEHAPKGFIAKWVLSIKKYWFRFVCKYRFKLQSKFDVRDLQMLATELFTLYYLNRKTEVAENIENKLSELSSYNAKQLMDELADHSMVLFKALLHDKYSKAERIHFESWTELRAKQHKFKEQFPVILSTTFSARTCLFKDELYDYIIMDEASQVSIETGALALTCARNAVIVGDTLQLPNVVTDLDRIKLDSIMKPFKISEDYDCAKYSFLKSACLAVRDVPQTTLREHYRCHPRIINFCNQKFYGGQLLIMTEDKDEKDVLCAYRTVQGNHAVDKFNQREIDVVCQEVLPSLQDFKSVGIVTPYNHQVNEFLNQLPDVETATIHKYQGREKDAIIMSVVDNQISAFADDPNLLNVAVSRAKKKFCLVVSGNEQKNGNVMDLLDYIHYNNCTVTESKVASIFDYLYGQYTKQRIEFLKDRPQISEYASENLTYSLICQILKKNVKFSCLKVFCHIPLRQIIRDTSLMSDEERNYAANYSTHVDFLIINKVSKRPVLCIETDGYSFHNDESEQHKRDLLKDHILESYHVPLVRLSTKGSGEEEKVERALLRIM